MSFLRTSNFIESPKCTKCTIKNYTKSISKFIHAKFLEKTCTKTEWKIVITVEYCVLPITDYEFQQNRTAQYF